ncbi:hypothetical protein SprV_0602206600 [Sparganum proliferum]
MPTYNCLQRFHGINGHSGRQWDVLDTFGSTAPTAVSPFTSPSSSTPSTTSNRPPAPPLPSSSSCFSSFPSSSSAPTSAVVAPAMHINTTHNPDTPTNSNTITVDTIGEDQDYTCPHCDRTFTSNIGLLGHLQIHRTETGEPVPEAPTYTRRIRLHCPHCPRTFMHHMGLIRPHAHSRKPAVDNRRLHLSTTFSLTCISPHINISRRKHPTATSNAIGKCTSRLGLRAAPVTWLVKRGGFEGC